MITSERSKEKQRIEKEEKLRSKMTANNIMEEEEQYLYCQEMMKEIEKKRKEKEMEIDTSSNNNYNNNQ
jgi:hypothetical protein